MSDLINKKFEKISKAKNLSRVADELSYVYNECSKIIFNNSKNKFHTYIPPKTYEDLKDCYSDGWLKVLLHREKYDASKSKEAINWIGTVIFNSMSNCMQRHHLMRSIDGNFNYYISNNSKSDKLQDNYYYNILGKYSMTTDDIETDIDINKFYEENLNEEQKLIFVNRLLLDKKVKDVAIELNKSIGYISEKYNEILFNLKEFLKK